MNDDAAKTAQLLPGAVILAALAAICTLLVAVTQRYTAPLIHANEQTYLEESLRPVLGGIDYENELTRSVITVPTPHALPGNEPATVYRVYADGVPAAALFVVTARDGFTGPIKLLIGIRTDGTITSIRVLQHQETPGLGDLIEASKSDWLQQFPGRSLGDPDREAWGIRRDGGKFDQLTGASITPRAVIKAIKETLLYFEANEAALFALPTEAEAND
jgi:electron transport complex protein RnfG